MIFTGLSIFAVVLLWRYGLIRLMVVSDRTYISSLIAVLYVVTCGHCFWRTRAIAREGEVGTALPRDPVGADGAGRSRPMRATLPRGLVTGSHPEPGDQGRARKAPAASTRRCCCGRSPTGCAAPMASAHSPSDTLMKLGLLGTIIGFIIMLAPIAGARRGRQGR